MRWLGVLLLLAAFGAPPGDRTARDPSAAGSSHGAAAGDLQWWTTHALDKVRPRDRPRPSGPIELSAARNEFEPLQLVLRAGVEGLEVAGATVSDLLGPAGARVAGDQATVYVERWLRVRTPSSVEGEAGEWPDALVPAHDRYAGEKRRAFPVALQAGRNQPLWIDLYVPPSTPPGDYRGQVVAQVKGAPAVEAPIVLRVLPFTLPSTSSLPTSFGFSGISALRQHHGGYSSDADNQELSRVYATALLRHRISAHGGSMMPPEWEANAKRVSLRWERYDGEVKPFLDGTVFGDGEPLAGARVTSIDVRTPPSLPNPESKVLYWREWVRHFEQRGWLDRLFLYLWDEPSRDHHYPEVLAIGREARQAAPGLRTLLTEQLAPPLGDVVDVWATPVNCIERRPGIDPYCEETVTRREYAAAERAGRKVWWYQSCMSHGCGIVGDAPTFSGWPSYVVDVDAVANRIMPWLAFAYDIAGELYYNTVEAYNSERSPWDDQYLHGGNGDGTLFYPGTPDRIGGRTHIPIESVRLKLIREGLEDYEYLVLLERSGNAELARREVAKLARSVFDWDRRPEALYAARRALAGALAGDRHSSLEASP
ncbi:MAG TPA: glycoside hydrolase domain-containing protein [Thermoanaerobaculia bacterium]|nr:glycoside hydrolase domain-containing protein [Thermoanaerobaculia bacterium]